MLSLLCCLLVLIQSRLLPFPSGSKAYNLKFKMQAVRKVYLGYLLFFFFLKYSYANKDLLLQYLSVAGLVVGA